eukprot:34072-Eustigmatos_ZCMA.PRE.1
MVPVDTRRYTCTTLVCPMRCTRAIACRSGCSHRRHETDQVREGVPDGRKAGEPCSSRPEKGHVMPVITKYRLLTKEHLRVEVAVEQDAGVGRLKVDAKSACTRRHDERKVGALRGVERLDLQYTAVGRQEAS